MRKMLLLSIWLFFAPVFSEAFGNSAVLLPKLGLALFDKPIKLNQKPWGLAYQGTVGTAFMQAIDYRWWWVLETNFAMGVLSTKNKPFISSLIGGAGVRYNIFLEEFRPHTGLIVHYLQFFGDSVRQMPLDLGWPIFVGLKPYFGLEWLVGSEMSLLVEFGYGLYVNIKEPLRQVLYANLAFLLYF